MSERLVHTNGAELWAELQRQRRSDVRSLIARILGGDPDVPDGELVDAVFALTEPHLHHVLVGQRQWSGDRYAAWLTDVVWSQIGASGHPRATQPPTKETSRP